MGCPNESNAEIRFNIRNKHRRTTERYADKRTQREEMKRTEKEKVIRQRDGKTKR